MWPPLIFVAVVVLIIVVVLVGTWPSEREERLRLAAAEITAAETARNTAEARARLAEALLTPTQVAELRRLQAAPPARWSEPFPEMKPGVTDLITNDPTNERPPT